MTGVEDDSRALNIIIHKPASSPHSKPFPILQATFIFSDHIRCIIAKQRLAKGRIQARRMKMQRIAGEPLVQNDFEKQDLDVIANHSVTQACVRKI